MRIANTSRTRREQALAWQLYPSGAPTVVGGVEGRAARVLTALVARASAPVIAATLYLLDDEAGRRGGRFASCGRFRGGTQWDAWPNTAPQQPSSVVAPLAYFAIATFT